MAEKRKSLGRGLDALLGGAAQEQEKPNPKSLNELPIEEIGPGPFQPRKKINEQQLKELRKENSLPRTILTALSSPRSGKDRPPRFGATLSQENLRRLEEQSRTSARAQPPAGANPDHWFNHWAAQHQAPTEAGASTTASNTTRGRDLVSTYL